MGLSLIAFDTDHIKRYVFGTEKLKEIRGASSLLDSLNRIVMTKLANEYDAQPVYANGGSGQFIVATERADLFGKEVQQKYLAVTGGGASITFVSIPLPEHIVDISDDDIMDTFELLQWHLQEEKLHSPEIFALASHPFLRLCDSCGTEYADAQKESKDVIRDADDLDEQYCSICQLKRVRDKKIKRLIERSIQVTKAGKKTRDDEYLWDQIISSLDAMGYDLPEDIDRPNDFNAFSNFKGAKNYLGLIYADANNMGRAIEHHRSLAARKEFAETIDKAIYTSVCTAIFRHLKINDHLKPVDQRSDDLLHPIFPFDILLMGGDDICMVVPASAAMDVALTIAETFRRETHEEHTLSVGVVLAPVTYPFGFLREMAESNLKFAKKAGADVNAQARKSSTTIDDTRINFMIVTGSSSSNFSSIYNTIYRRQDEALHQEFHATLRPYAPESLHILLNAIRGKEGANLGRSKLHQIREAVFQMNLTTSVIDGLTVLRNWREKQRNHITRHVYQIGSHYQMPHSNPDDPVSGFPRVIFPWFTDGKNGKNGDTIYRTS
ncbi:MAG: hypothetical protein H0V70_15615, partial [Ktedonobacteraceae bacterium]|nr:hypothetical protein [Ktedonobacteraceae bacterium]